MKEYEIWVGYYHLGQGYDPPTKPELLAKVKSVDFKTACFKFELQRRLDSIISRENKKNMLDRLNNQDYEWFYRPQSNSNSWTGEYYESEEEAMKSFGE